MPAHLCMCVFCALARTPVCVDIFMSVHFDRAVDHSSSACTCFQLLHGACAVVGMSPRVTAPTEAPAKTLDTPPHEMQDTAHPCRPEVQPLMRHALHTLQAQHIQTRQRRSPKYARTRRASLSAARSFRANTPCTTFAARSFRANTPCTTLVRSRQSTQLTRTFRANTPCTTLVRSRQSIQLTRITPSWFLDTCPVCVCHWWKPWAANSAATCGQREAQSVCTSAACVMHASAAQVTTKMRVQCTQPRAAGGEAGCRCMCSLSFKRAQHICGHRRTFGHVPWALVEAGGTREHRSSGPAGWLDGYHGWLALNG